MPTLVQDAAALVILACARASAALDGSMAEAGVFRGGTARLICEVKGSARLHLFDVFETLQAGTGSPDSAAQEVRGHFGAKYARRADVEGLLAPYDEVHLHPGLFPESAGPVRQERFSFVHLDLDLEQGTSAGLAFFYPRLVPGGCLIVDDYHSESVRRAFTSYFGGSMATVIDLPWGQGLVAKVRDGTTDR